MKKIKKKKKLYEITVYGAFTYLGPDVKIYKIWAYSLEDAIKSIQ